MYRVRYTLFALVMMSSLLGACKKSDDGSVDGIGGAGGAAPDDLSDGFFATSCTKDEQCNDDLYCNGEESCSAGFCRRGTPIGCDDGIECTVDQCVESEKTCLSALPDLDQDGSFDSRCEDADGSSGDDCDDNDPDAFPGNTEICDPENRDEDCDPTTLGFRDSDNDGSLDAFCCNPQRDGKLRCGEDCDDHKANVNPRSPEVCDFFDNDCNGEIDEGVAISMFPDKDHDGHGDDSKPATATCPGAVGFAAVANDCNDKDPEIFLGQFEICDQKDNNCDGNVDEVEEYAPWFKDSDGDGYGDPESSPILSCYPIQGRVLSQNDCDDEQKTINPNAVEQCDAIDNDCNGLKDYKLSGVNNFEDDDDDGIADAACDDGKDCNDTDPRTGEGMEEVCDHVDNDCDGKVDEQTVQNIWYIDSDGDGWGVVLGNALASCDPIPGRATQFGDCDDGAQGNAIHPGAAEICDGQDQDCDGVVDEGAGVTCKLTNAISTCTAGACRVFSCVPGFADADGVAENGCESPVDPDSIPPGNPCLSNSDCNDHNICNGIEVCHQNACRAGTSINCASLDHVVQGNVTINDGLDIKALAGVQWITGDLIIDSTSLTNLVGLEALKTIGGNLIIQNNDVLTKLSGSALSYLEVVGGDILVTYNQGLTSVDLPSLISTNSLTIVSNDSLKKISGYANLATVGDHIVIGSNLALTSITGFGALEMIGGASDCDGPCEPCYDGGESESGGGGGLDIRYQGELTENTGFAALKQVDGGVCIDGYSAPKLSLPALVESGSGVSYTNGYSTEISFPQLKNADYIQIQDQEPYYNYSQTGLTKVSFPALKHVYSELSLSNLSQLSSLVLGSSWDAKQIDITRSNIFGALSSLGLSGLTSAQSITINIDNGPTNIAKLDFSNLKSVGDLSMSLTAAGLKSLYAPQLTSASSISIYSQSSATDLETIDLSGLTSVSVLNMNGDGTPPKLATIDLSSLSNVADTISIQTQIPSTKGAGLKLGALTELGNGAGTIYLCTGFDPNQSGSYVNDGCSVLESLHTNNPLISYSSCGQCTIGLGQ